MKVSIIDGSGTVYSENVDRVQTQSADFATMLETHATNLANDFQSKAANISTNGTMSLNDIINAAAAEYDIDVNYLRAVAKLESNFNPNSVSSSGAIGVMQLMPSTAEGLGVQDPYNAYDNIMGGAKYLKKMLDTFGGDKELAYAAYNAGPNAVKRAGGIPQNNETPKAVAKVMQYYNEGVTVPDVSYEVGENVSVKNASARNAQLAADLAAKLKEFPNHISYDFFVEELQKETKNSSQSAYELLNASNRAIRNMIDSGTIT